MPLAKDATTTTAFISFFCASGSISSSYYGPCYHVLLLGSSQLTGVAFPAELSLVFNNTVVVVAASVITTTVGFPLQSRAMCAAAEDAKDECARCAL